MLVHIELSISFFSICDKSIFWYDCIVYLHRDDLINMLPRFVRIFFGVCTIEHRPENEQLIEGEMGPRDVFYIFCPYTAQEDTHTRVDTGACRSARTSKPVNCKITVRLQHHTNYKTPYDEKQSVFKESKYDIAGRTRKPKTTLWKKRNVYSRQLQSSAMPTTRGQRYTETNDCQTPIKKKKNKIGK